MKTDRNQIREDKKFTGVQESLVLMFSTQKGAEGGGGTGLHDFWNRGAHVKKFLRPPNNQTNVFKDPK